MCNDFLVGVKWDAANIASQILRTIGVAMLVAGVCVSSANVIADGPGEGVVPAPCKLNGGICIGVCPIQIPHCGFHGGPDCACG